MKLLITVEDKTYEVEVEVAQADHAGLPPAYPVGSAQISGQMVPPAAPTAHKTAPPVGEPVADESKVCRSPVAGVVVKLIAQPAQVLQVGDTLLVLEAMKMETHIAAPVAGKVAALKVAVGDTVQAGAVVVELE